jgi:rod shape-determining protein MreD
VASDALSPAAFGAGAMAMTLVAAAASWLNAEFFAEHLGLTAVFLLGGKLAFDAVFLLMEQRMGVGEIAMQLVTWSLLSAVVTAIAGLTVLVIFRPFTDIAGGRA